MQIEQQAAPSAQEAFAWSAHPSVNLLYLEAVRFLRVLLLRSRFLKEETVLALQLELFVALSRSLAPSHSHRAKFPVSTFPPLHNAVVEAALAAASVCFLFCCFLMQVPLPSGQLSPLIALLPPLLNAQQLCAESESDVERIARASSALSLLQHAPNQFLYRPILSRADCCVRL